MIILFYLLLLFILAGTGYTIYLMMWFRKRE